MTQPKPVESTSNHPETESPSFVKRGKLWIPEAAQRRSLIQKFWHWTGFREKKLWDVLQLLIVPTALAIGAFYLQETAKQRDLQIADERAKQETLNHYFDQVSALLFDRKLRTVKEGDEARIMARARTLTALRDLDGERKGQLIRFLQEAKVIQTERPIINLRQANLNQAKLLRANLKASELSGVNLSQANLESSSLEGSNLKYSTLLGANLANVTLWGADLSGTDLSGANLNEAGLSAAQIQEAKLIGAKLVGANLSSAQLRKTKLIGADLSGAVLSGTDFSDADLSNVNLSGAQVFQTNFSRAKLIGASFSLSILDLSYLCGTTMPNGTRNNRDCDTLKKLERNEAKPFLPPPPFKKPRSLPPPPFLLPPPL